MRIKKITVDNFRCFKHLETELENILTVFVAANGQGKTAILEAITYLLGVILGKLPQTQVPKLKKTDIRKEWTEDRASTVTTSEWKEVPQAAFVRITGMDDEGHQWDTTFKRDSSAKTKKDIPPAKGGKEIHPFADHIMDMVNSAESPLELFPVFAYYDTGRAVIRKKPEWMRNFRKEFNRYDGYKDALDGHLNYKQLIEWLFALDYKQNKEMIQAQDWTHQTIEQKTIQLAIEKMLPGFKNLRTHTKPLDLMVDVEEDGNFKSCFIDSQLSDGYKIVLVLVLDIVTRILELNSDISWATPEKLLEVPGIILIDEIDLHLHPSWQQRIVGDLQRTFPNIQFIVTTHSPQVVSSVPKESVRIIENGEIVPVDMQTQGVESQDILARVFGTDPAPQNDRFAQMLDQYASMTTINDQETEEETDLYKQLVAHFGDQYEPLKRIQILKAFRRRG